MKAVKFSLMSLFVFTLMVSSIEGRIVEMKKLNEVLQKQPISQKVGEVSQKQPETQKGDEVMQKQPETQKVDEVLLNQPETQKDEEVWSKRAIEAQKAAQNAYTPNPGEVLNHINQAVHLSVVGSNSTRRGLQKNDGSCTATNPIDQCWRCDKNWAKNRMRLADCVMGFGRKTTGGKGGQIYVVTDNSDNDLVNPKEGTLRHAVIQSEPLWIIFDRDMIIRLNQELIMASDKTIDGRGAEVHIENGAGLTLQYVKNIIICNLQIKKIKAASGGQIRSSMDHYGTRGKSDGDGISVFGSSNIWIDHISMSNCQDGLIDVIECSTAVTISNCHFTQHNDVMLFGASAAKTGDKIMQVTLAFNHFGNGLTQRMPRCRWGFCHILNNDYTHWLMYAIGGSSQPSILSQGNRFNAPENRFAKEVTKRDYAPESEWKHWNWKSEGDVFLNGAFFTPSGDPDHKFTQDDHISPKSGSNVASLTRFSGYLPCSENKPC